MDNIKKLWDKLNPDLPIGKNLHLLIQILQLNQQNPNHKITQIVLVDDDADNIAALEKFSSFLKEVAKFLNKKELYSINAHSIQVNATQNNTINKWEINYFEQLVVVLQQIEAKEINQYNTPAQATTISSKTEVNASNSVSSSTTSTKLSTEENLCPSPGMEPHLAITGKKIPSHRFSFFNFLSFSRSTPTKKTASKSNTSVPIESKLSTEMLLQIFSFISDRRTIKALACTNSDYNLLAKETALYNYDQALQHDPLHEVITNTCEHLLSSYYLSSGKKIEIGVAGENKHLLIDLLENTKCRTYYNESLNTTIYISEFLGRAIEVRDTVHPSLSINIYADTSLTGTKLHQAFHNRQKYENPQYSNVAYGNQPAGEGKNICASINFLLSTAVEDKSLLIERFTLHNKHNFCFLKCTLQENDNWQIFIAKIFETLSIIASGKKEYRIERPCLVM